MIIVTQTVLNNNILKLRICSSTLANQISTDMSIGSPISNKRMNNLVVLNGYISQLLKYNLSNPTLTCLSTNNFNTIYNNALSMCNICNCT